MDPSTDDDYADMERLLLDFLDEVRAHLTAAEPAARLRQLVGAHVAWRLEHPDAAEQIDLAIGLRAWVKALPDEHRRRIRSIRRLYQEDLREILRQGMRHGTFHFADLSVTAFAIVTLCNNVNAWYDPGGALRPADVGGLYGELVLGMVGAG